MNSHFCFLYLILVTWASVELKPLLSWFRLCEGWSWLTAPWSSLSLLFYHLVGFSHTSLLSFIPNFDQQLSAHYFILFYFFSPIFVWSHPLPPCFLSTLAVRVVKVTWVSVKSLWLRLWVFERMWWHCGSWLGGRWKKNHPEPPGLLPSISNCTWPV